MTRTLRRPSAPLFEASAEDRLARAYRDLFVLTAREARRQLDPMAWRVAQAAATALESAVDAETAALVYESARVQYETDTDRCALTGVALAPGCCVHAADEEDEVL